MKLWMKMAIITSVGLLLFFGYTLNSIHSTRFFPEPAYLTPLTMPLPLIRQEVTFEKLMEGRIETRPAFRPLFFEVMNLRGVQLSQTGSWMAIFSDQKDHLLKLRPGEIYDGVKVESVDAHRCLVRYGSIERLFELP